MHFFVSQFLPCYVIWAVSFESVSTAISQEVLEDVQGTASAAVLFWPIIPILGWLICALRNINKIKPGLPGHEIDIIVYYIVNLR